MATATATATKSTTILPDVSERCVTYYGTIAISASPDTYATGGLTLSFVSVAQQNSVPDEVRIWTDTPVGWQLCYKSGTKASDGKVLVFGYVPTDATAGTLPLGEFDNATAIPASLSGATIKFAAKFRKGT